MCGALNEQKGGADHPQDRRFSITHKRGEFGTRFFNFSEFSFACLILSGFIKNKYAVAESTNT